MKSKLSSLAIGAKIKAGKNFWVGTNLERKAATACAKFQGIEIRTRADFEKGGFNVYFINSK